MADDFVEIHNLEGSATTCPQQSELAQGPSICSGCNSCIFDQSYLLMAGKTWHSNCLRCAACAIPLNDANSCFFKEGVILCKEDYFRKHHSRACAGCGNWIGSEDLVMRARDLVYHVRCFLCVTCRRNLVPGEKFSVEGDTGRLHCWNCWGHMECYEEANELNPIYSGFYEGEFMDKSRRKRKSTLPTDPGSGMPFGIEYADQDQSGVFPPQKTKRMRTSFKHNQLRAMKNYFNINHNPDAKDLKQLAQETGLTKRVLQVWFQNARAKFRRGKSMKDADRKSCSKAKAEKVKKEDEGESAAGDMKDLDTLSRNDFSNTCDSGEDIRAASTCISELDLSSPEMGSSSGDSRSDSADVANTTGWIYENGSGGMQFQQVPPLLFPDQSPEIAPSYHCTELQASASSMYLHSNESHNYIASNEYFQMECGGERPVIYYSAASQ